VDAFAWDVVGSVAGVIGAIAAIVFGLEGYAKLSLKK